MSASDTNLTGRWFIDGDRPLAASEHTQELRVIDMVPAGELEQKLVQADGLQYSRVSLRGARILASSSAPDVGDALAALDAEQGFEEDDEDEEAIAERARAIAAEDGIALPVNGFGRFVERMRGHGRAAGAVLAKAAVFRGVPIADRLARAAHHPHFGTAMAGVLAVVVVGVCGVALAANAGTDDGSEQPSAAAPATVAAAPEDPAAAIRLQQRALQRLTVEFALRRVETPDPPVAAASEADMVFDLPEPEVSARADEPRRRPVNRRRHRRQHRWSRM